VVSLLDALADPLPCHCQCHDTLDDAERTSGVVALFRLDDIFRGWGYVPLYEPRSTGIFREQQLANDPADLRVALREHACLYRRLVGFALHEAIHALCGEPGRPNHGVPFGLPYCVPDTVPPSEEAAYLREFNFMEARAFVGLPFLARALLGIDWAVYAARDVGTYGFAGGNAIVPPKSPGYRSVAHVDSEHSPARYEVLARRLEAEATAWFTPERVAEWVAQLEAAERTGAAKRKQAWPDPGALARKRPRRPGRNDMCLCGSGKKWKACCGS
jgi:SEC-C motif